MKNTPRKPDRIREKRAPYARAPRAKTPEPVMLRGKPVPDDVLQFCEQEGILEYLRLLDALIGRHFPGADLLTIEIDEDPETGERTVGVDLSVGLSVEELIQREKQFVGDRVSRISWPQISKIHVCIYPDEANESSRVQ